MKNNKPVKVVVIGIINIVLLSTILSPGSSIGAQKVKEIIEHPTSRGVSTPTIDGPSSIKINETATFYVCATDSSGENIKYGFDWKYYNHHEFTVDNWTTGYYGSGHTLKIDHTFEIGGNYMVAVIAENYPGEQSEVGYHSISVNGGYVDLEFIDRWTKPDKFIPEQKVDLLSTVKNVGNRDCYGMVFSIFFDGKSIRSEAWVSLPGGCLAEAGETIDSVRFINYSWPNNYDEHKIEFWCNSAVCYLNKSATENEPPLKPSKPSGPTRGEPGVEYTYSSTTTDPCEHQIYYSFDWGDNTTSGWIGPYKSGQTASASHEWYCEIWYEGTYQIKVKAKDIHGLESEWSDPLWITVPKNKQETNSFFFQSLEKLIEQFKQIPLLEQILTSFQSLNKLY